MWIALAIVTTATTAIAIVGWIGWVVTDYKAQPLPATGHDRTDRPIRRWEILTRAAWHREQLRCQFEELCLIDNVDARDYEASSDQFELIYSETYEPELPDDVC